MTTGARCGAACPDARALVAAVGLAAALASALPCAAAGAELDPVSLESLRNGVGTDAALAFTPGGLEIRVDGDAWISLPFPAQELELDAEADAPILLSWTMLSAHSPSLTPPWRYVVVPRLRARVRLDLRIAPGWSPWTEPVLHLAGSGTVTVHAMSLGPVSDDMAVTRAAFDRALLCAPQSIDHTTINHLTPSYWSASGGTWFSDIVAGAAVAVFLVVLTGSRLRRGGFRPGRALAAAALVALGVWGAHFLVRFLPMAKLRFEPDPEARIRDDYYFAPDVGALAALARATLRTDERVGARGEPDDWFGAQTLCFSLAPRPCAIVKAGETVHAGISGVGRLRPDEIDAIVSLDGGPLPDGFVPVAAVSPRAVVARRR